ncbi:hypothetical protein EC968_001500 [Mortierella alpina]|nr:hypothetical protein EC968_001500 [Mortierella alpina]
MRQQHGYWNDLDLDRGSETGSGAVTRSYQRPRRKRGHCGPTPARTHIECARSICQQSSRNHSSSTEVQTLDEEEFAVRHVAFDDDERQDREVFCSLKMNVKINDTPVTVVVAMAPNQNPASSSAG